MIKTLTDTSHGVPQLLGMGVAGAASGSMTNVLANSYTWVDIVMAVGGALGGTGALIGSLVALYNAYIARKERKAREKADV